MDAKAKKYDRQLRLTKLIDCGAQLVRKAWKKQMFCYWVLQTLVVKH